jgi:long-chain fatty acid transport protein
MARGGTGVALPCGDGSTQLFNPAGIAGMRGWTVSGGLTLIAAGGGFTDDLTQTNNDLQNDPIPVPHGYVTYGFNEKLAAGLALFVPYGLGTKWLDTFDGRFLGYDNDLQSIYLQGTVGYQLPKGIKVGGGLNMVFGSLELTQRLDLSEFPTSSGATFGQIGIPFHTEFSNGNLHAGGATGFGGNLGVSWDATDWLSVGGRYMTRVKLDYEGTAVFEPVDTDIILPPGNPISVLLGIPDQPMDIDALLTAADLYSDGEVLSEQTVNTSITMPDQGVIGVALKASPAVTLLFDLQWINWSVFDTLVVEFENQPDDLILVENYQDTYGFRFGVDWAAKENLALRGGYLYHDGAAPAETVTPLLPEGSRNEFTIGLGYRVSQMFGFDLAYQYLRQNDRRGRTRDPIEGEGPSTELNSGLYSFNAHLFGATLVLHF